jgi:CRISPR-associated endonuclease/helicase Cas3
LSALFHDVGKATEWFQQKLTKQERIADFVRHEVLSAWFVEHLIAGHGTDDEWLARLVSDPSAVIKCAFDAMMRDVVSLLAVADPTEEIGKARKFVSRKLPFGRAIHWLVLSHHRMPRGFKTKIGGYRLKPGPYDAATVGSLAQEPVGKKALYGLDLICFQQALSDLVAQSC